MRPTCSLYIDTGYLLASAATRVTGSSLRSSINVEYPQLLDTLLKTAQDISGLPVLRAHWYDSAENGVPDAQQQRIGELARVKLRLGRFGYGGEQKGVDLRIGLDLVAHARNKTSDVFFLVSGDDDLTEAVEEAQAQGVLVVVLAVPTTAGKSHGVNRHLLRAADDLHLIDGATLDQFVIKRDVPPPPKPAAPVTAKPGPVPGRPVARTPLDAANAASAAAARPAPSPAPEPAGTLAYSSTTGSVSHVMPEYDIDLDEHADTIDDVVGHVVRAFNETATPEQRGELMRARPSIPRDIDRALLLDASDALDRDTVDEGTRHRLRALFWEKYDRL